MPRSLWSLLPPTLAPFAKLHSSDDRWTAPAAYRWVSGRADGRPSQAPKTDSPPPLAPNFGPILQPLPHRRLVKAATWAPYRSFSSSPSCRKEPRKCPPRARRSGSVSDSPLGASSASTVRPRPLFALSCASMHACVREPCVRRKRPAHLAPLTPFPPAHPPRPSCCRHPHRVLRWPTPLQPR